MKSSTLSAHCSPTHVPRTLGLVRFVGKLHSERTVHQGNKEQGTRESSSVGKRYIMMLLAVLTISSQGQELPLQYYYYLVAGGCSPQLPSHSASCVGVIFFRGKYSAILQHLRKKYFEIKVVMPIRSIVKINNLVVKHAHNFIHLKKGVGRYLFDFHRTVDQILHKESFPVTCR